MSANAKIVKPVTGNSSLVRPRFSPGLLLRDDDLKQGIDYTRDLSRLLFRSLIGCGVVCGLEVSRVSKGDKLIVTVAEGVALDCRGDPIHVPQPQTITIDPSCCDPMPPKLWIVIRRTEKCCAPRSAACSCDDDETPAVCTREHECYEIRILPELPTCGCACEPVPLPAPESQGKGAKKKADAAASQAGEAAADECRCVSPELKCYVDHYAGTCGCECGDCDCEWVVLALLEEDKSDEARNWKPNHSVRRFVRPVLMRDPVAWNEQHPAVSK